MKIYPKMLVRIFLGVGATGIGLRLLTDLAKPIMLPFFPDILDAITVISAGLLLMFEGVRHQH